MRVIELSSIRHALINQSDFKTIKPKGVHSQWPVKPNWLRNDSLTWIKWTAYVY